MKKIRKDIKEAFSYKGYERLKRMIILKERYRKHEKLLIEEMAIQSKENDKDFKEFIKYFDKVRNVDTPLKERC
jgi:hypothetical protein